MMKHLIKKHRCQCMLYSFAMAMDIDPDHITALLGHDGTQILWPELPEPNCYRGFHINEMVYACWYFSRNVFEFPRSLRIGHSELDAKEIAIPYNLSKMMNGWDGVILTDSHAMAWDGQNCRVLDPDGPIWDINNILDWHTFYYIEDHY